MGNCMNEICAKIKEELFSMGESGYRDFSASLIPTVDKGRVIGIRIPVLRKYAKSLDCYEDFLADLPHEYFEEDNLHAFLIERERDFDKCIKLLNTFLPYVDNWATCDSMKPKVLKNVPEKLLVHIRGWIMSSDVYAVRYAINLLMSFYLDEAFDKSYLELVSSVKSDEYYINMMRAWYFATALAMQYDSAIRFIENQMLDLWTHNKTIQKAIESCRITDTQKAYLRKLKRKG